MKRLWAALITSVSLWGYDIPHPNPVIYDTNAWCGGGDHFRCGSIVYQNLNAKGNFYAYAEGEDAAKIDTFIKLHYPVPINANGIQWAADIQFEITAAKLLNEDYSNQFYNLMVAKYAKILDMQKNLFDDATKRTWSFNTSMLGYEHASAVISNGIDVVNQLSLDLERQFSKEVERGGL